MKREAKSNRKTVRGMPTAVVMSILIHAALFLLAGVLVVFTVVKSKEVEFEPPKASERPKMKLKKPKVKIKKSSKPKPTTRIVTKVQKASLPDIQLPEMSDMNESFGSGIGGFDILPDLGEVSVFGSGQTIGNDLEGTFYDLKRDRQGRAIPTGNDQFKATVSKFVRGGWKVSFISRYYHSPKKLYATSIMIPPMLSYLAPDFFGEPDTGGYNWLVLYKGQLVHKDGGRFRFRGRGDDLLIVRLNGSIVLDGSVDDQGEQFYGTWQSSDPDSLKYYLGNRTAVVGDWFTLEPGVPQDMEVLIGEVPGGEFSAMLVVEQDGVEYEKNRQGGPILPMFKTAEPSRELVDEILKSLVKGEACVTNGPVFCDYDPLPPETPPATAGIKHSTPTAAVPDCTSVMRTWSFKGDKILKAEYIMMVGDKVVLKTARGKHLKIPVGQLSEVDREFIELAEPPRFNIDFSRLSSLRKIEAPPGRSLTPIRVLDYTFGVKLKQISTGEYSHRLCVEYYAIGAEIDGDQYVLLDREESDFVLSEENQRSYLFRGQPVELVDYELDSQRRGTKPGGYLITISDERGKIIQHAASSQWLWKNIENLKKLPVGSYLNKTCTRVYPTSPKSNRY